MDSDKPYNKGALESAIISSSVPIRKSLQYGITLSMSAFVNFLRLHIKTSLLCAYATIRSFQHPCPWYSSSNQLVRFSLEGRFIHPEAAAPVLPIRSSLSITTGSKPFSSALMAFTKVIHTLRQLSVAMKSSTSAAQRTGRSSGLLQSGRRWYCKQRFGPLSRQNHRCEFPNCPAGHIHSSPCHQGDNGGADKCGYSSVLLRSVRGIKP